MRREIRRFQDLETHKQRQYIFRKVRNIVEHAYQSVPFYQAYYKKHSFSPNSLRGYDDIERIPIVTKQDLRGWSLDERSNHELNRTKINTGGTSGHPLHFYVDGNAFAREWAHMHTIWEQLGYSRTDLKLTIRGSNIGGAAYKYSVAHNEFVVNTYKSLQAIKSSIAKLVESRDIKFIHGYPSAIYEFARFCAADARGIVRNLQNTLRGVFLGSEYPAPVYRDTIEDVFQVPTLAWYGHSEMAVLAPERSRKGVYEPMQTYGLCEAVEVGDGESQVVGTSYYNTASPFIRYATGDRINNCKYDDGVLREFQVSSGRMGEFVTDKKGHRISLTALIFGRHHKMFEYAKFVQVHQDEPGQVEVIVTPAEGVDRDRDMQWRKLFDASNVDISVEFNEVDNPVRTEEGKVQLLI